MKIADVMTRDVATCRAQDTLERAAEIMWNRDCGVVPVVDDEGRVLGMLTDRDACMAAWTQGKKLAAIRVASVMTRHVKSVRADEPVSVAEERMSEARVRRLPVLDARDRLVGLVSLNDLARRATRTASADGISRWDVAETLASVCRPWCWLADAPELPATSLRERVVQPEPSRAELLPARAAKVSS